MFFFNIEEIILNMFFGTPYYIENLKKRTVHHISVVKSRKVTNMSTNTT